MTGPVDVERDKIGWDQYESTDAVCVDVREGSTPTPAGKKPCYVLELRCKSTDRTIIYYLNCQFTKSKNRKVAHNSNFACLLRLCTGENPVARFSRASTLKNKFRGIVFESKYTTALDKNSKPYFKASEISPVHPVSDERWFDDGKLKPRACIRKNNPDNTKAKPIALSSLPDEKSSQQVGNHHTNDLQDPCKNSVKLDPVEPSKNRASGAISSSLPHLSSQTSRVESLHHAQPDPFDDRYLTIKECNEKERVFEYRRRPDETQDDYLQRVIDTSTSGW